MPEGESHSRRSGKEGAGQDLRAALAAPQFPRSARYDPEWVLANLMGPNVLWLTEALTQVMELRPGMRVLDMGCGRALSSIFLAQEFDVRVWATDLWISVDENWSRIRDAKVEDRVFPIHAEAHSLPFAEGFFDAVVSMDAYHYFGTDDLYLGYFSKCVVPGGQIGIVVPGLQHEFINGVPPEIAPYWSWDFCSFHSPEWWRNHWEKTGLVRVESWDTIPEGWKLWLRWLEVAQEYGYPSGEEEAQMLRVDADENFAFSRLVARRAGVTESV